MRIAIFRNDLTVVNPDGYNSQEIGLARGLAELGHQVVIFTVTDGTGIKKTWVDPQNANVTMEFLPFFVLPVIESPVFRRLEPIIANGQFDLVQINDEGSVAAFHIARSCVKRSIPFVIYQGIFKLLPGRSRALFEWCHAKTFRRYIRRHATAIISKTNMARKFLETRGYKDVSVVPVGLDVSSFSAPDLKDWNEALNLPVGKKILLYVGVLEARRKTRVLVELSRRLDADHHLIVVGDGPERSIITQACNAQKANAITYIGPVSQAELPALYAVSDCLLLPSEFEIYGMVILEALYFGIPVVCSPQAGPADIVVNEQLGQLVDGFDYSDWESAIRFCTQGRIRREASNYRTGYVSETYNWSHIASTYLTLIKNTETL